MYSASYIFLLLLLSLFSLIVYSNCETFDEFYNYVNGQINTYANYTLPTNNQELYATNSSDVKDFGTYDFVIIGGGSAGALLAGRLSEVFQWKILLLEAGGNQTRFSDIPGLQENLIQSPMNWGYYTKSQTTCCQGMVNKKCVYPRGKVLGGSSVINGMISTRGSPKDYDDWAKIVGDPTWSFKSVLPYFRKFETVDFPNADPLYHGTNGPIHTNYTNPPSTLAKTFEDSNIQSGLKKLDYNGRINENVVSRLQFTIKGNKRDNSAHEYLDPNMNRNNLKIVLNAFVTKIIIKHGTAKGVQFIQNGQTYKVKATKEVILSAGSINTPQLLLLSGVGPKDELKKLGIDVQVHSPHVGKHLKDHPMFVNLFIRTNLTTNPKVLDLYENLKLWVDGSTPLTNGAFLEQIAFIKNSIELLTFTAPSAVPANTRFGFNLDTEYAKAYADYNLLTDLFVLVILLTPKSEGSVTLQSASPVDYPVIDNNYFSDADGQDIAIMYEGIQYVLNLLETPALKAVNGTLISTQPGCEDLTDKKEYWYCAIRHLSTTIYHPTSTTRMGRTIFDSVVDSKLKVHNVRNLRVVDAGVMPNIIRGHTMAPTYMIAEKAAQIIKRSYGIWF